MAQAIKSENNYLAVWTDARTLRNLSIFAQVATYKTNLSTYSGQVNSNISSLSSAGSAIQSDIEAVTTANNNIKTLKQNQPLDLAAAVNNLNEKQAALVKLIAGADPLDIRSQELSVEQKRNSLYDAQTALADYTIKAPFDGIIAAVSVKVGDTAGSASIATIVTKQQIAEISLNELDAAKIKVDQKVTSTFDAIDGLEITGKVADIDTIGVVS
ncbi:MAG: HlyD family efflux transporter periplasmic adaptor subunit, partial [Candidatus Falkowbacteria bacterium]|nr:HlyD family efflux transporter periplasmic adaptor subunit [Candidatus Falkowbacteria bacterium]